MVNPRWLKMNGSPRFVIFCGPSGCGKSTLAVLLREKIGAARCAILSIDHYYHDLAKLNPEQRTSRNFDCLEAIDRELLIADVRKLAEGKIIRIPNYDFVTHTRSGSSTEFAPQKIVLIEGVFAQALLRGNDVPGFVVYLDLSVEVCLERRVIRDQAERGRSREEIETRFRNDILPSIKELVLPQKSYADLVLDATKPREDLCDTVLKHIA